jgi:hypothetical protein
VNAADSLSALLRDFHREKLTMRQRHVAVAKQVSDYAFNNTYQYVISREDVHLQWLEAAIAETGGSADEVGEPALPALPRGSKSREYFNLVADDARAAGAFVAAWRPRLAEIGSARHRSLMKVILGETLEQKRFFEQIGAGNHDLLGRRSNGPGSVGTGDGVMAVRWVE